MIRNTLVIILILFWVGHQLGGRTDSHGRNPIVTLWDNMQGGILNYNGGRVTVMPHHGKALTVWNFRHRSVFRSLAHKTLTHISY